MYNHILYLSYWIVNSVCLYLASRILPNNFVLGNWRFIPIEGAIYSGFWITFFVWTMWDFVFVRDVRLDKGFVTFSYFWVINTIGIWIVARLAYLSGLGISAYYWAILFGLVLNIVQRLTWKVVVNPKKV